MLCVKFQKDLWIGNVLMYTMTTIMTCNLKDFWRICELAKYWLNKILWDYSLRGVLDELFLLQWQGSFCACAQPIRDSITKKHCFSLAGCIHKISLQWPWTLDIGIVSLAIFLPPHLNSCGTLIDSDSNSYDCITVKLTHVFYSCTCNDHTKLNWLYRLQIINLWYFSRFVLMSSSCFGNQTSGLLIWDVNARQREVVKTTGPRLNIKTVLSMYGDFHVKDKTAVRTSYL